MNFIPKLRKRIALGSTRGKEIVELIEVASSHLRSTRS